MKDKTKQFFLYKHRFTIGYILIGIIFTFLLCILPILVPGGLSDSEMNAAVTADSINLQYIKDGNAINLPYFGVQKICLKLLGLNIFAIRLPSVIFGAAAAFFIVLLLNRWFKNDVAIISSMLTTLSTAFLCLANFGTPDIMYVFWLSFILWLGSKIAGNKNIKAIFIILFTSAVAFSLYTPHLCYVALAILVVGLIHPHLRCTIKYLKPYQLIIAIAIFLIAITPLIYSLIMTPSSIINLAFAPDFRFKQYSNNIRDAFMPFFSFALAYDSVYLAPLFGLGTVTLMIIGALASVDKLFTSKNYITILLIIFSILISGLSKNAAVAIIMPVAILTANAIESLVTRWHNLFPNNPYAHIIGAIPIILIISMMLFSGLSHYLKGYRYTPRVTKNFNSDIQIINKEMSAGEILIIGNEENADFYRLFEKYKSITVLNELPSNFNTKVAFLGKKADNDKLVLERIATSSKSRNSDRLYIYTKVSETVKTEETGE